MTMTIEELQLLVDAATPGKRVQFHPAYCEEAKGTPFSEWDTSHDSSAILPDGTRKRIGSFTHAADAALADKAPDLASEVLALRAERDRLREAGKWALSLWRGDHFGAVSSSDAGAINTAFFDAMDYILAPETDAALSASSDKKGESA